MPAKALSLKLKEDLFQEVESITRKIHLPRNTYINHALTFYNRLNRRRLLKKQLLGESALVQANSMEILREFEKFEDGIAE
jgi:hypothetical protein